MLCDIDTWPQKWMQEGMDKMAAKMADKIKEIQEENEEKLRKLKLEKEEAIRQQLEKEMAIKQQKKDNAIAMLKDGLSHEAIAKYTDLTPQEIQVLAKTINN